MSELNRNYKSSLFTHLFGEPEKELELYNAFAPAPYPPDTPVMDLTLTDVFFKDRVNDLSFRLGEKLVVFFEHQSSPNENMPLRELLYCGRVFEKLIDNSKIYSEKRVTIPVPEFYMLYNGVKPFPEKKVMRLSDAYDHSVCGEFSLELIVTAYNINKGFNENIVKRSKHLYGYSTLVTTVRDYEIKGLKSIEAVTAAIKDCIERGILTDYLFNNASEVSNMLIQEWSWADAKAVWERDAEERGEKRGEKRGEERSDLKWRSVIADKDTMIADKDALIALLQKKLGMTD